MGERTVDIVRNHGVISDTNIYVLVCYYIIMFLTFTLTL